MGCRSATEIRQTLGWALVAALTVAALTAIGALRRGVISTTPSGGCMGTSLGFALFSATGAGGSLGPAALFKAAAAARRRRRCDRLGRRASPCSWALSGHDDEADGLWRAFGCAGIVAVAGSHACLVLGARRPVDGDAVRLLVAVSLPGAVDATALIVPVSGLAEYDDDGSPQFLGRSASWCWS